MRNLLHVIILTMVLLSIAGVASAQYGGIKLETLIVLGENESSDDEPYIWVYGIVIDASTIGSRQYVITINSPGHENVTSDGMEEGDRVSIPSSTGSIFNTFRPLIGKSGFGVLVMGWEEDNTPNSNVVEGYNEVGTILNNFIDERVQAFNFEEPSDDDLNQIREDIKARITEIFKDAVHWYNPFSWDPDDPIGNSLMFTRISEGECISESVQFVLWEPGDDYEGAYLVEGSLTTSGPWSLAGNRGKGWHIGDFNGDGKADIFRYLNQYGGAEVFLSNGKKFVSCQ